MLSKKRRDSREEQEKTMVKRSLLVVVAALLFQRRGGEPVCFDFVGLFRVLSKGLLLCWLVGSGAYITCLFFLVVSLTPLGSGDEGTIILHITHILSSLQILEADNFSLS